MKRPYIDDAQKMALTIKNNTWDTLREEIWPTPTNVYTYDFIENGNLYAFSVSLNRPLTRLVHLSIGVVRFAFTEIDDESSEEQRKCLIRLFEALFEYMEMHKAYYNVRVPSNYPDIIYALNTVSKGGFMCGGNQTYMDVRKTDAVIGEDYKVFRADDEYLSTHKDAFLKITNESFLDFRGQYHISPVTYPYADRIYRNWIDNAINEPGENQFFLATEQNGKLLGYALIDCGEGTADISLTAVSPSARGKGVYKSMISELLQICRNEGRLLVAGTQFDNYGSQVTWSELGMKPFMAFYNMHYDMR